MEVQKCISCQLTGSTRLLSPLSPPHVSAFSTEITGFAGLQGAAHLLPCVRIMWCIMRWPDTTVTNTVTLFQSSPPYKPAIYEYRKNTSLFVFCL